MLPTRVRGNMKKCVKRDIFYREWKCQDPEFVLLLVHGLGGHSNNWEYMAEFFRKNNITSYGIELKGFGATETLKGHVDSLDTYLKDVRRLHYIIKKKHKGKKIFIAGESMGGLIAFMIAIKKPKLFSGTVCISPGFASLLQFSISEYVKMSLAWLYNPKKQFTMPFNSEMCTRDLDCRKQMDADPLEHRLATPNLLLNILLGQAYSKALKHKVKTSTLFLLAENDTFVCPKAGRKVFEGMKAKDKTLIQYPEMSHSLASELGREKVFSDTLGWLKKRI